MSEKLLDGTKTKKFQQLFITTTTWPTSYKHKQGDYWIIHKIFHIECILLTNIVLFISVLFYFARIWCFYEYVFYGSCKFWLSFNKFIAFVFVSLFFKTIWKCSLSLAFHKNCTILCEKKVGEWKRRERDERREI